MTLRSTFMIVALFASAHLSACLAAQQGATRPVLQAAPAAQAPTAPAATGTAPSATSGTGMGTTTGTAVSSSTYKIGTGDMLQLTVWKEPGMSNPSVPVRPDGMISLSLLGDIPAAGQTPMQLSTDVATRLKKYVNDPLVTVTVLGVQSKEIYLLGEIQRTGAVALTPGMTPLQAIAAAGGLSPFAKSKRIYILRKASGKESKIAFDYKKAIKNGDLQGVSLLPGDTVIVP